MTAGIHPTAVVDPSARLGERVSVGAFTWIGPGVEIGDGTTIGPHCSVHGPTRIGRDNRIVGHAAIGGDPPDTKYGGEPVALEIRDRNLVRESVTLNRGTGDGGGATRLGSDPQDKKYGGEPVALEIGDRNLVREFVTLNRGTGDGGGVTRIGSDNWFLAYTHVAHDCVVADYCVFSNNATLAGHVHIDDHV